MTDSKHIARLIGPTLIAVTISEALNLEIWATNMAPVTYLNGCMLFVAGLSIVRVHNRWTLAWPLVVTLVGWGAIFAGLVRMFAPQARQGGKNTATYAAIVLLWAVGLFLSIKGYGRKK
jgi:hypothetical protein